MRALDEQGLYEVVREVYDDSSVHLFEGYFQLDVEDQKEIIGPSGNVDFQKEIKAFVDFFQLGMVG